MKEEWVVELWNKAVTREANGLYPDIIMRFAELVAAETREECAKCCDEMASERSVKGAGDLGSDYVCRGYENAAKAIRGML